MPIKQTLGAVLRNIFGRFQLVRIGRFILNEARLDVGNDMATNGELDYQINVLQVLRKELKHDKLTIFDIGANKGDWTKHITSIIKGNETQADVHCFEPSPFTFNLLSENLKNANSPLINIHLHNFAISDKSGTATLNINHDGAGSNSLYQNTLSESLQTEEIRTMVLSQFLEEKGIDHVDFIKIDTEGHDLIVLKGLKHLFEQKLVNIIQFEYNWRWVDSRGYLRDVFDLIENTGYQLGKVTPLGIELYDKWLPDLETFIEGNYTIIHPSLQPHLNMTPWWKTLS